MTNIYKKIFTEKEINFSPFFGSVFSICVFGGVEGFTLINKKFIVA